MASFKVKVTDEDKGMTEAIKWWTELATQEVVAGILEKDAFELANPTESNTSPEITLITKAVVHEFGSKGKWGVGKRIPQRAPIRKGTKLAEPDIKRALEKGMRKVSSQSLLLGLLGVKLVRGIKKAIDQHTRSISKDTIDNKGHATILKDTNQLYNAYDFEVRRRRD